MASSIDVMDETGNAHQIASSCQRSTSRYANGSRTSQSETTSINSGAITVPVARRTPNSTMETQKKAQRVLIQHIDRRDQRTSQYKVEHDASQRDPVDAIPATGAHILSGHR